MAKAMFVKFQSPQWGDNSKYHEYTIAVVNIKFQSPQWGDNSKLMVHHLSYGELVSVPAMGR